MDLRALEDEAFYMQVPYGLISACLIVLALGACDENAPITIDRYRSSDELLEKIDSNVAKEPLLHKAFEIDHSRLGAQVESYMPPAKVLMFSDGMLESELLKKNQLTGIDLPLRILAYESEPNGPSKIIYNSYDYLASRYDLSPTGVTRNLFEKSMSLALSGINPSDIATFSKDQMQPNGIVTLDSPFDFNETYSRVLEVVNSQDDAVVFGSIDFQSQVQDLGVDIPPTKLLLFGAPGPGAKAMRNAPTLGLDAFCQKFLVWQDDQQVVHLSFNDLVLVAERQGARKSLPLRVINFRLSRTFADALSE
jgi:uncharacterized protein (DUF302 family)